MSTDRWQKKRAQQMCDIFLKQLLTDGMLNRDSHSICIQMIRKIWIGIDKAASTTDDNRLMLTDAGNDQLWAILIAKEAHRRVYGWCVDREDERARWGTLAMRASLKATVEYKHTMAAGDDTGPHTLAPVSTGRPAMINRRESSHYGFGTAEDIKKKAKRLHQLLWMGGDLGLDKVIKNDELPAVNHFPVQRNVVAWQAATKRKMPDDAQQCPPSPSPSPSIMGMGSVANRVGLSDVRDLFADPVDNCDDYEPIQPAWKSVEVQQLLRSNPFWSFPTLLTLFHVCPSRVSRMQKACHRS